MLERSGFNAKRVKDDWGDSGIIVYNKGRANKDYNRKFTGKTKRVIRFVRSEVDNVLFN